MESAPSRGEAVLFGSLQEAVRRSLGHEARALKKSLPSRPGGHPIGCLPPWPRGPGPGAGASEGAGGPWRI